jgi:hypothetical protein
MQAVEHGVNVVVWFAMGFEMHNGRPAFRTGPNTTCVAEARRSIEQRGLITSHLISIGGWNTPHPDTSISGEGWFRAWDAWNAALPEPYDGFDWDLEGNSDVNSPYNTFTADVLNLVLDMSVAAKKKGFIVTMIPPQSYLDHTTHAFNLSLQTTYADWHPEFAKRGQNCYAYLLAAAPEGTFDLVSVQLYESWSRADQALIQQNTPPASYLEQLVGNLSEGWSVNFDLLPGLRVQGNYTVHVEPTRLLLGLAFGSDDGSGKSAFFSPESAKEAYSQGVLKPRGYAFLEHWERRDSCQWYG